MNFRVFALLSGAFGATASCLAKVAFSPDSFVARTSLEWCLKAIRDDSAEIEGASSGECICQTLAYIPRGLCFVGTILLNIFMVGSFLEGMEQSGSVAGTAMATGSNFFVSAIFGFIFWGESFSLTWLVGFSMVVAGTLVLSTVDAKPPEKISEKVD